MMHTQKMWNRLLGYANMVKDREYRDALQKFLAVKRNELMTFPASIRYHHNWTGGLLRHTLETTQIALYIAESPLLKGKINIDHLLLATILHDVGKLEKYAWSMNGWTYKQSDVEDNRGHPHEMFSITLWNKITRKLLPEPVEHAILSHHHNHNPHSLLEATLFSSDMISARLGYP